MSKTIFITGASSGLGKATAKLFASRGWQVVATMRNPEKETELTGIAGITVLPLDVTDPEQIRRTVATALSNHDIDVVFNNAGYGLSGPLDALSDDQIRRQLDTNLMGVIRITQAFIPHFKKKHGGLFITTTSVAGFVALPLNSIYNASKWALEGFTEALFYELSPFGIQAKTIAPGVILTDFGTRSLDHASTPDSEELGKRFIGIMLGDMSKVSQPEQVAETVFEAATDGKDQVRYIAGQDAAEFHAERATLGNEDFRRNLARKIWPERA